MAQPTSRDVHTDAILTNISVAYIQNASHFVATQVFPAVPVEKQTDKYYKFDKEFWFRDEAQRKGDIAESAGGGYPLSTDSYSADVWAWHHDIGDQTFANYDNPLDPERNGAQFVTQTLLLRREIQWATDFMATGIWDTDKTGGTDFTKWSDYTGGSDPVNDVDAGVKTVLQNTGFFCNRLVLGFTTFQKLRNHPDLIARVARGTVITEQVLASIFGLDQVLVCKAIKNTGLEGETTSYSFVQTDTAALLCYANPAPALEMPSAGYHMTWSGVSDGLGQAIGIRRIPLPKIGRRAVRIEGQLAFDNKVVATDLGYFFSTAV